ncbi:hypothetical protein SUGI_0286270 [Cryptomeria japonica]|nr:hypothetical protein SUGI_0286270 [Cryptomeria japonica]
MHDLLRDLGRDISKTRSPFRLWSPEKIAHIEKQGKESVLIRGIKVQTCEFYEDSMDFIRESGRRWANFPHTTLPPWISLKKLRVLELSEASKLEESWSETADPPVQLRVLKIIHARNFLRFPRSIGFLKHLQKISFDGKGAPIEDLPVEFCCLQSLEHLELVGCHKLKSLPSKIGNLTNLEHLRLKECSRIEGLPKGTTIMEM